MAEHSESHTLLISWLPTKVRFGQYLQPDWRTLTFAGVATLLGVVVISTTPIYLIRRVSPLALLSGTLGDGRQSVSKPRRLLVVSQIAITTILLYVAGLSVHSLFRVLSFNYGFDADRVLVVDMPLTAGPTFRNSVTGKMTKEEAAQLNAWFESYKQLTVDTIDALEALPGIKAVAGISDTPIPTRTGLTTAGTEVTWAGNSPVDHLSVVLVSVTSNFASALGATLLAGESFDGPSVAGRTDVVVINETFARQVSPLAWPLGMKIISTNMNGTVIGVVKDMVDSTPGVAPRPQIFQPLAHHGAAVRMAVVRTEGEVSAAIPAIRDAVESRFGPLKSSQIRQLSADVDATVAPWRGRSAMLMLVGSLCVPLALLGLSSGLLFAVRAHTREIGIRLALGATPTLARSHVIRAALVLASIGGTIGVVIGCGIGAFMDSQLFEVSPLDPFIAVFALGGMLMTAWGSSLIPAARASRIDPAIVLRDS